MVTGLARSCLVAPLVFLSAASLASAAEFEKFVFEGANAVIVVEVKKALAAPLVKKHIPGGDSPSGLLKSLPAQDDKAKALLADPDFTAMIDTLGKDAERLAAVVNTSAPDNVLIIMEGKFDEKVLEKGLAAASKVGGGEVKKSEVGEASLYELKGKDKDKPAYLLHLDNALLVGGSEKLLKDAAEVAAGKKKWTAGKELAAALAKGAGDKTIWMAGKQEAPGVGDIGFNVAITVTENVVLEVVVDVKDEDTAMKLEMGAKEGLASAPMQLPPDLAELVKGVTVARDGKTVMLKATITGEAIEKLAKMIPALIPMK